MRWRVIESPYNEKDIPHEAVGSEEEAKASAKRIVVETHHPCFIECLDGERWVRGSIMYVWWFGGLMFYNHR